ncbi:MAG: DMT family transporter [Myxococcota bacterium]
MIGHGDVVGRGGTIIVDLERHRPAALAALFCFSAGPVGVAVQRLLAADFAPSFIVAVQMTLGAAVLWALRPLFPHSHASRMARMKGLALGALHPGLFMIVFTAASARLDAVTGVLLLALMPAAVAVGGRIVLGEALRAPVLIGIAVSIAGLLVLVSERKATGISQLSGYALSLLGLALAAGGVIGGRTINTGVVLPWFPLAPLQVTGAALVAWIGVLGTGTWVPPSAVVTA